MNTQNTLASIIFLLVASVTQTQSITIQLDSQSKSINIFNLSAVSSSCYDQMLIINVVSESRVIFNKTLGALISQSQDGLKRIQIFNYEADSQNIQMYITPVGSATAMDISTIIRQSQVIAKNFNQGIFMMKSNIQNFMLPFNLVSEKYKKVIVEESSKEVQIIKYNYEPFLQTFWNEHKENQLLLSWLPYFSRCEYKSSSRIFLQDLVSPWQNYAFQIEDVGKICNRAESWLWGVSYVCASKKIATECVLEELNVTNTKKQPWWKNTNNIIFYFLNSAIVNGSLLALDNSDSLTLISQKYYANLIPLSYKPLFDLSTQTPNKFTLNIDIASISDMNSLQILQASLVAEKINIDSSETTASLKPGETVLIINVQYLTNFQTLFAFGKQTYIYVIIFLAIAIAVVTIGKIVAVLCNTNLNFMSIAKLLLFPAAKGFSLAFAICASFLAFFFLIAGKTNFSAIIVNFDNSTEDDNWKSYTGRFGLTIFFVGNFLLSIGISQSFKVMTLDQIKIILQDDQLQKQKSSSQHQEQPQDQQQQQNRPIFVLNNMNSHRKYLFSCLLSFSFILLMLYYVQINLTITYKCVFCLIGSSILHKLTIAVHRHSTIKELLYLSAILITEQSFMDMMIFSNGLMWEIIVFYVVKLCVENGIAPALEILAQWGCVKMANNLNNGSKSQQHPSTFYRFCNSFKQEVMSVVSQSRYQKSLFYTNLLSIRFTSLLFRPFMVGLIELTIKYNYICKDVNQTHSQLSKIGTILFCFAPIDIFIMLLGIKFFQGKFNLDIIKCLEFNRFKFNKRKIKWINDSFVQTRSVQSFYRQFQKFCFSSQMYLLIFIISFSLFTVMIGLKIIIEVGYVSFIDPAMLFILCIVWITGNVFSLVLSFIAIKLKFYERKEDGRMRAKLEIVQKILKKNDYSEYLQTDAIKNYFLFHCKQWIVQNLATIFDKEDFFDNNYEFLLKYKHYKSLLKKHKIQQRKKLQRKIEQNKNQLLAQSQQKTNKMVIKLPRKQFQQLARPLLSSWLYIAKQFTYLKSLVCSLKNTKKKQTCEFCSMNIELEVIQKIQFASIVNQYRILNVGRALDTNHFINFYKFKQEYITLCIQCKDRKLYLEKKHLDINGAPRRILQKWVMVARSRMLHRGKAKDKDKIVRNQ